MIKLRYNDFVNEEFAAISREKLRNAVHDIIVGLKKNEKINIEDLSDMLLLEYKITISPYFIDLFLSDFIEVKKGNNKINSIFKREDSKWLGVRDNKGNKEIRNNLLYLKPNLSKHKRRLIANDEKNAFNIEFEKNKKNLKIDADIIKKSLILQRPEDGIEILKNIYYSVIKEKKYVNTYSNCWKLMMLIGKQNKLNRVRGWFKIAPDDVKEYYAQYNRIDYELEKY